MAGPLIFLLLFLFYPLFSILRLGITDPDGLTARHLMEILSTPRYRRVILFTIRQAFYSAMVTLLLGLPAAHLLSTRDFPGKSAVKALLTVPFVLPTITVAIGFILLLGTNGIVNDVLDVFWERKKLLYNLQAIVLAHVFFNFAIVVRLVGTAWGAMDRRLGEAASSLGASPWDIFRYVTFPLLLPSILAAGILTFMYSFMSFTIVFILGDVSLSTMEVEIFILNSTYVDHHLASGLALVQLLFTLFFLLAYTRISSRLPEKVPGAELRMYIRTGQRMDIRTGQRMGQRKDQRAASRGPGSGGLPGPWRDHGGEPGTSRTVGIRGVRIRDTFGIRQSISRLKASGIERAYQFRRAITLRRVAVTAYTVLIAFLILGPVIEVVRYSFLVREGGEWQYTLRWYRAILEVSTSPAGVGPMDAILNSLFFGFMTVMVAVPLGTVMAYSLQGRTFRGKNILGALFMLPLGISAITLGLGLLRGYPGGPLMLGGTWYGIVIAHSILAYPFVLRSVSVSLGDLDPRLREAAVSLGADRTLTFFRVELPLILPGMVVGAVFAFSISMGELGATYLLHSPEHATLPMLILRYMGTREQGVGIALSVILMLVVFLSFFFMERIGLTRYRPRS